MKIYSIMTLTCTVVLVAQFYSADAIAQMSSNHRAEVTTHKEIDKPIQKPTLPAQPQDETDDSGAELQDVTGVDSIIVFKSGVQAYSNRKYQWADVPEKLSAYHFAMIPGGGVTPISARVVKPGWFFLAISVEAGESAREYLHVNGWQQTTDSFAYTAGGKTTMFVYKKQLSLGMLELPRLGWAGPVLLIQKTDVLKQPDEGTPMATCSPKEKTVPSPLVVLKKDQVLHSNIESSSVSRAKTSSKEMVRSVPLVNSSAPDYETIHEAAEAGNLTNVIQHLQKGENLNAKDRNGMTPLLLAVERGHLDVIEFLVDKGANMNTKDKNGATPLLKAANIGNLDVVKILVEKGAEMNAKDKYGATPLLGAVRSGKLDVVTLLVEKGAEMKARDDGGNTALTTAVDSQKLDIVKYLTDNGADVNTKSQSGKTPLLCAVRSGRLDVVTLLVEKGANVNAKGKDGKTPLMLAKDQRKNIIVKFLKQNGAKE